MTHDMSDYIREIKDGHGFMCIVQIVVILLYGSSSLYISIEVLILCEMDVRCLLHEQFPPFSGSVLYQVIYPQDWVHTQPPCVPTFSLSL